MLGASVFKEISPINEIVLVVSQNLFYRVCPAIVGGFLLSNALKTLIKRFTG